MPSEILVFASSLCLLAEYAFVEMHKITKCHNGSPDDIMPQQSAVLKKSGVCFASETSAWMIECVFSLW